MSRCLALLLTLVSAAGAAQERIVDFASEISIESNGTLLVTETITVQVQGERIQRGILRDFPTRYTDRSGAAVVVSFDVLNVQRNAEAEPYKLEPLQNGTRVRIGNASRLLTHGLHEYRISYRTGRQLGFFEPHDELYWNVTGNGWPFAIERASARVRLPRAVPAEQLRAEAYTGAQGARGRNATAGVADGEFLFESTQRLAPNEGLTIVAAFPKGIVAAPSPLTQAEWIFADNAGDLLAITSFVSVLIFVLAMWWKLGRDPRKGPAFPRYDAPPQMSAAAVRFIDRMRFDARCLAAGILTLGARGYLKVHQKADGFVVQQTGVPAKWLPAEKPMAEALFRAGPQAVLGRQYDPAVAQAKSELRSALAQHYKGVVFRKNGWPLWLAVIAAVTAFVFAAIFGAHPLLLLTLVFGLLLLLMVFSRLMPAYTREGRRVQDHIEGLRQYLSVAEREDLARMKAPEQTPAEFARLLPYALALDVEQTWANRFAAVIGTAAVAAAVSSYYGGEGSTFAHGPDGITGSLDALDSTVSSASTPPGSESGGSDSGGGGSSGGGGGGGGGDGW